MVFLTFLFVFYVITTKNKSQQLYFDLENQQIENAISVQSTLDKDSLFYESLGAFVFFEKEDITKKILYLRVHENICFSCYLSEMLKIKSIINNVISDLNFNILGSYQYITKFEKDINDFNLSGFESANRADILNDIPADKLNIPYFFTITKNHQVESILFIERKVNNSFRINNYINMLHRIK